ncbi:MAG: hypothetical protein Q7V19_03070 [Bacteroidales bacterium]|nr:hypothetical protein [Bacteroidales bacterium]
MKKIITIFVALLTMTTTLKAQENLFKEGDMVLNAGVGFGWYSYGYGVSSLPAISLSLEKGVKEIDLGTISIGGIVGFKHASYSWSAGYDDYSWTDFIVAARGAIHVNVLDVDNLDTYGGVALGLRFQSYNTYDIVGVFPNWTYEKVRKTDANPLFAVYFGGRYYFNKKFGAFGEVGYGLGYLTLGVSYKF